jgi:hypothetical protein
MARPSSRTDKSGMPVWLLLLLPLVLCAPCLLLPLAAAAITAAVAAFGLKMGLGIGVGAVIALVGGSIALWLYIRGRRAAACCALPAEPRQHASARIDGEERTL